MKKAEEEGLELEMHAEELQQEIDGYQERHSDVLMNISE